MTWCRSSAVSCALSAMRGWSVSGGTAANAGFAGASTVSSGVVFSESTRLAVVNACTSDDSAGLPLAAVAAGTAAIAAKLPGPSEGTAAQPEPKGPAAFDVAVPAAFPLALPAAVEDPPEPFESPELHALSARTTLLAAIRTPRGTRVHVTGVAPCPVRSTGILPDARCPGRCGVPSSSADDDLDGVPAVRTGGERIGARLGLDLAVGTGRAAGDGVPSDGEVVPQDPLTPQVGVRRGGQLGVGPRAVVDPDLHAGDAARLGPGHAGDGQPARREAALRCGDVDPRGDPDGTV